VTHGEVTTRPAVDDDRAFVRDVFVRAIGASMASFDAALDLERTTIITADGVDVGFVLLIDTPHLVQVHTIAIAPEHQGRGVGSEVLTDVVNIGRQTGRAVMLSVLKSNRRAEALYTRLGFVVVEESTTHRHMRFVSPRR
jgi:ribosomal protein S18 acetylase RimI-like enzyme